MQKSQDCIELQNPTYLLVLDFRSLEEWLEERLVTSLHHERLQYLERYKGQDNDHLHYNKNARPGPLVGATRRDSLVTTASCSTTVMAPVSATLGVCQLRNFRAQILREGCKKSKWKFKMAFAMEGGGSRGGLVCH